MAVTHDELLAKINPDWDEYVDNSKFRDAIRAVVELTRPVETYGTATLTGYNEAMWTIFQAIEKELG